MFLLKKNQTIGKYTIVFPHKEGAYAQTYRVKDADGKVKFMKLIFMEDLKVFQYDNSGNVTEEEISKLLKHDNLCSFVDIPNNMIPDIGWIHIGIAEIQSTLPITEISSINTAG